MLGALLDVSPFPSPLQGDTTKPPPNHREAATRRKNIAEPRMLAGNPSSSEIEQRVRELREATTRQVQEIRKGVTNRAADTLSEDSHCAQQ